MVKRESISTTHHNKNIDNGSLHSMGCRQFRMGTEFITLCQGPEKTQKTQLRLEREGYSIIIILLGEQRDRRSCTFMVL
jgi:hypothetical protein